MNNNIIYCIYKYNKDYTRSPMCYYREEILANKFCAELNAELTERNIDNESYSVAPIALLE